MLLATGPLFFPVSCELMNVLLNSHNSNLPLKEPWNIKKIKIGEQLKVHASDMSFQEDIVTWCDKTGNILTFCNSEGGLTTAIIQKK